MLNDWMRLMVDRASFSLHSYASTILAAYIQRTSSRSLAEGDRADNLLRYSLVLAESIRRTWVVSSGIQGLYSTVRNGRPRCMGDIVVISGHGFGEARSAHEWMEQRSDAYGGLMLR